MNTHQHYLEHQTGLLLPSAEEQKKAVIGRFTLLSSDEEEKKEKEEQQERGDEQIITAVGTTTNMSDNSSAALHPATHAALISLRDANPSLLRKLLSELEDNYANYWNSIGHPDIITLDPKSRMITELNLGGHMIRIKTMGSFFRQLEESYTTTGINEDMENSDIVATSSSAFKLRRLNLGGTDIPLPNLYQSLTITGGLPNLTSSIQELYLGGNGIGGYKEKGIDAIIQILSCCSNVRVLDLRYNDLNGELIESFVNSNILTDSSLEILHLEGNELKCQGVKALSKTVSTNTSLKELYLGANQIGTEGAVALAKNIQLNSTLVKLYLEGNQIGDEGANAFTTMFEERNGKTNLLQPEVKDDGTAVCSTNVLEKLYVDNNGISKEVAKRLAKALNSDSTISESLFE